jgi:hypothetical protein
MGTSKQSPDMQFLEEARLITRWTRRYAQSRSFPVLVFMAFFMAYWFGFIGLTMAGGWALHGGHMVLFWACVAAGIALLGLVVWVSVPRWGGRWLERIAYRYYEREGSLTPSIPLPQGRMKTAGAIAALLFVAALLTHINLGRAGYTSIEYGQPISALYVVPFSVFLALATRTYIKLLFPLLYGVHAILLVVGIPLRFWSNPAHDMPFTIMGYMVLAALVGHAYNRYALARLKRIAHTSETTEVD